MPCGAEKVTAGLASHWPCVTDFSGLGPIHLRAHGQQYNLVPVKGRRCHAAGKVTAGLASHWPCVTDFSGLCSYGMTAYGSEMSTAYTPHAVWLWHISASTQTLQRDLSPPFHFLNNSCQKLTDFNNFWYVKS